MTAVLVALAAAGIAGLTGWKLGRASGLFTVALSRPVEHLSDPADPGHEGCRQAQDLLARVLAAHIDHIDMLEHLLAANEHHRDLDAELRQLTEGGGS